MRFIPAQNMSPEEEVMKLRLPGRQLRINNHNLLMANQRQKDKRQQLEDLLKERDKFIKELEIEKRELEKFIDELKRQRDMYKEMTFKPNKTNPASVNLSDLTFSKSQKPRARKGHLGFGRKTPKATSTKRVYLTHCPHCHSKLKRSNLTLSRFIEDIPSLLSFLLLVTEYQIERQWCPKCQKEVRGNPPGVLSHSKVGLNTIVLSLYLKYGLQLPLGKICHFLANGYGLKITPGGISNLFSRTKEYLGKEYDSLLIKVRGSPVKHADETSWRINGINNWLWEFLTEKAVYLKMEESRGKGVPKRILKDQDRNQVLVRDDYPGYKNLPLSHQSCWAHLLRKSKERVVLPRASKEMKNLHGELKDIFNTLQKTIQEPFEKTSREQIHQVIWKRIQTNIINKDLTKKDSQTIQTRIKNQGKNLLTALLFPHVPLTNNLAERTLRPMVVMRKISGGSRSPTAAQNHAVNMSVYQTIQLNKQPLFTTLQDYLLKGSLEGTE